MVRILEGLEPADVFYYFEEICKIPHGSGNTKAISDYCAAFAREHELVFRQDAYHNIIIWKKGTEGYEQSGPVMIQGHLDMVCEKEADCDIDFDKDGINIQQENGVISAKGTTLGADDGIAVAYALALLASQTIPHPPLEVVLTADEEVGMPGAKALDCSLLKSKILLNLDSEEEGYLLASCAGGVTVEAKLFVERGNLPEPEEALRVIVSGLQGGHSGTEIDKGRGNACQLLGRVLYRIQQSVPFALCKIEGGRKDNAIPREACAEILADKDEIAEIKEIVSKLAMEFKNEYRLTDPDVYVVCEPCVNSDMKAIDDSSAVIRALMNLPGGVYRRSFEIENLVQTSLNLGIMKTETDAVSFSFSVRSSLETEKRFLVDRITCLMDGLHGKVSCFGEYPAWEYSSDSSLRNLMMEIYEEKYGKKPVVQAIHAGVECGIFASKIPGLDCISFGPDLKNIHTPNESMDVASVKRTWEYLLEILRRLK